MTKLITSEEKVNALTAVIFLAGVIGLYYSGLFGLWVSLLMAGGVAWGIRQFLTGHVIDIFMVIIVFGGSCLVTYYEIYPKMFVPILFLIGGVYVVIAQVARYYQDKEPEPPPGAPEPPKRHESQQSFLSRHAKTPPDDDEDYPYR